MSYVFSPSALKIMDDCPCCFWWSMNYNIKRPQGIPPVLAIQIDSQLKKEFDSFRMNGVSPPVLQNLENGRIRLHNNQKNIDEWRSGISHKYSNNVVLKGKVDDVLEENKSLIMFDIKTTGKNGSNCTEEELNKSIEKYKYRLQLEFYSYLLGKKGFSTKDYGYLLFYFINKFDNNGNADFGTMPMRVNLDIKNVEKVVKRALDVLNMEEPPQPGTNDKGKVCEYCSFSDERYKKHPKNQPELIDLLKAMSKDSKGK